MKCCCHNPKPVTDRENLDLNGSYSIDMTRKERLFSGSQCPWGHRVTQDDSVQGKARTKKYLGFFPSPTLLSSSGAIHWLNLPKSPWQVAWEMLLPLIENIVKDSRLRHFKKTRKCPTQTWGQKLVLTPALGQMPYRGWFLDFPRLPLLKLQIITGLQNHCWPSELPSEVIQGS